MVKLLYGSDTKKKYSDHKRRAKRRNIPFLLTFEEWLKIWTDSGHFHERGFLANQYCMARFKDEGPYAVGNVRIVTNTENCVERKFYVKRTEARQKEICLARGLKNRGEKAHQAKLTEEQVRYIRKVYVPKGGEFSIGGLARKFGVDNSTVWAIIVRKKWKYVL